MDADNDATMQAQPTAPTNVTESGEQERPSPAIRVRKIDCNGEPEIAERRMGRGGSMRAPSSSR
jgi:hypothetical protein